MFRPLALAEFFPPELRAKLQQAEQQQADREQAQRNEAEQDQVVRRAEQRLAEPPATPETTPVVEVATAPASEPEKW